MTAVIYARYSSDNQREESIEGQIRECTAYAEKNGITVIKHYIDRAFSAKTDNRPEFQQSRTGSWTCPTAHWKNCAPSWTVCTIWSVRPQMSWMTAPTASPPGWTV